jgi:type I restriction enzyme S subunit
MGMLRAFPVPIGPAIEQAQILAALDAQIDVLNEQERFVELGLRQATAQRKNILKSAFSGQLVSQDPSDEPASALLERIRAERATTASASGARGRKAKAAA